MAPRRVKGNERAGCEIRSIVIRNCSSVAWRERHGRRVCGRRNGASGAHVLILALNKSRSDRPRLVDRPPTSPNNRASDARVVFSGVCMLFLNRRCRSRKSRRCTAVRNIAQIYPFSSALIASGPATGRPIQPRRVSAHTHLRQPMCPQGHSCLNATIGSTLVARRAGIHAAMAATANNTMGTPTKDGRSTAPRTRWV